MERVNFMRYLYKKTHIQYAKNYDEIGRLNLWKNFSKFILGVLGEALIVQTVPLFETKYIVWMSGTLLFIIPQQNATSFLFYFVLYILWLFVWKLEIFLKNLIRVKVMKIVQYHERMNEIIFTAHSTLQNNTTEQYDCSIGSFVINRFTSWDLTYNF